MGKLIKIILALALLTSAFFMGKITGEKSVIMSQNIYGDGHGTYFSEYNGEVHYYE